MNAQALESAADPPLPTQIVQAISIQAANGGGEAQVKLQPGYLGDVTVSIIVDHGGVTASIEASSPAVREWIAGHEPMLRQGLGDQGLRLDRLVVQADATHTEREDDRPSDGGAAQHRQPPPRQKHQPAEGTFEVVV